MLLEDVEIFVFFGQINFAAHKRPKPSKIFHKEVSKVTVMSLCCSPLCCNCATTWWRMNKRWGQLWLMGEPVSYHKVAGSVPLVCMSKGNILNSKVLLMLHVSHHHQCMNLWITLSCFGQKHLINALKCKCFLECYNAQAWLEDRTVWVQNSSGLEKSVRTG